MFVAFGRASDAVEGAAGAQRKLAEHAWPEGVALGVRMGMHTGEPFSSAGFALTQNLVVIPAGGVLVTEVSLDAVHWVNHGHVLADFSSGDFQVTSHWVQVEYVAGPELTPTPVVGGLHP